MGSEMCIRDSTITPNCGFFLYPYEAYFSAWLNRIWKSNQCGYVVIKYPGSQRTRYFNFVPPLHSRVFRILKSTRRDKPLLYSCRAANLLQETYLGCITIWKANFFWQAISKKQKFPRRTYLLPAVSW